MQKIFDRSRLKLHRNRAANNLNKYDFLIEYSSEDIFERLQSMNVLYDSILEIGARTGNLTKKLLGSDHSSNLVATDISEKMLELNPAKNKILMDEEDIDCSFFKSKFDIIVSVLNLHNLNDIQNFFTNILNLLSPQGVFIASLVGGSSLISLRKFLLDSEIMTGLTHSPHVSPFASAQDIYRLLQISGFKFIITDIHKIEVEYENALKCMHDIRNMGESNILIHSSTTLTKTILQLASQGSFLDFVEIITLTASLNPITQKSAFL